MTHRSGLLFTSLLLLASTGCRRGVDLDPPNIVYGETECHHCRMIITDVPFAAAIVLENADGVRKFAFDDIGCLVAFMAADTGGAAFVHDFESKQWLKASQAVFIRSDALQTPMASNLAACATPSGATAVLSRFPGETLGIEQVRQRFEHGRGESPERSVP